MIQFESVLKKRAVPISRHADYRKWLRYYLDFRGKYTLPDSKSEHVRLFIEKLQKKNQTPEQQKQAAHTLSLYFESQNAETKAATISTSSQYRATTERLPLQVSEAATSPSTPLRVVDFIKGESSNNLSRVEATTPRYSPLPDMQQPPRASKTEPAIPQKSAGSRYNEWRCLEKSGSPEWDKICVKLRVQNFNFDDGILTVHGKGSKDRTVPIPQTIMPALTGPV